MTTWTKDPNHSHIDFKARHMMISWVRGSFHNFDANVEFDPDRPENTQVEVSIDAASIDTGVNDRDNHLRSADFLDATNHPTLTYKSRRIEVLDSAHARLIGDLTIRGLSREVVLDVEYAGSAVSPYGKHQVGFNAQTKINRKDWGLEWNVALETGGWLVGDEIQINIELELVEVPETVAVAEASAD